MTVSKQARDLAQLIREDGFYHHYEETLQLLDCIEQSPAAPAAPCAPPVGPSDEQIEALERVVSLAQAEIENITDSEQKVIDDGRSALSFLRSLSHSAATPSLKGSQGKSSERG